MGPQPRLQGRAISAIPPATLSALRTAAERLGVDASLLTVLDIEELSRWPSNRSTSDQACAKPNGHFSQATAIEARGRLVFLSGMTSRRADGSVAGIGDVSEQTRQVCENLKAAVEAAGGTLDDIVPRRRLCPQHRALSDAIHKVSAPSTFTGASAGLDHGRGLPRW
jgi:enamine deaminase RidA (YjgF/YER057c/UK114 family)